jgi:hypothetical protein
VSESAKTGAMVAVAAVTSLLAWATTTRNYSTDAVNATARVNQVLFEKFTDPLEASSLKILKYDSDKEQYDEFEVSKDSKTGVWSIPSNENYPADANKQMSDAANLFIGLKILNVASEKRDEHKLFGVLEPDKAKESEGGDGVGQMVQFRDSKGDVLADLIIGKEDAQDPKKRFVRIPAEDAIYVAEINPTSLSTDFKQWIESDLLKLSANDIETIGIRNYTAVPTGNGTLDLIPNYDADIKYDIRTAKWAPESMTTYSEGKAKPKLLEPSEELNATKLNDMKNALDNLRIANVSKKPAGVAADLRGEQLGDATKSALARRGFFPVRRSGQQDFEILSENGDLQVTLKDGVQYLLRFGKGAGVSFEPTDVEDPNAPADDAQKKVTINRFLLVTTRVDESKFPEPQLERVPQTVEELKAIEAAKKAILSPAAPAPAPDAPAAPAADAPAADAPAADAPAADAPAADAPAADAPAADAPAVPAPDAPAAPAADAPAAPAPDAPAAPAPDAPSPAEGTTAEFDVKPQALNRQGAKGFNKFVSYQEPAVQDPAVAQEPPAAQEKAIEELTDDEWKERLEAEKERINKENQRKLDQRKDKMEAAQKRVAELNARFADWYYIVSDAEFQRLKIELGDLIAPKGVGAPNGATPGLPSGLPGLNIPGLSDR